MTTLSYGTSVFDQDFVGRLLSPFCSDPPTSQDSEPVSDTRERYRAMRLGVRSSPGYAVSRKNGLFKIAFWTFPGVQPSDIHIDLEDDGRLLHITGSGVASSSRRGCRLARFDKRFVLADDVNTRKMQATYHDNGVLILSAPMLLRQRQPLP